MWSLKDKVAEANGRGYDCDAATIVKLIECRSDGVEYVKGILELYETIKAEQEEEKALHESN